MAGVGGAETGDRTRTPVPGGRAGSGHRGLRGSGKGVTLEVAPAGRPLERPERRWGLGQGPNGARTEGGGGDGLARPLGGPSQRAPLTQRAAVLDPQARETRRGRAGDEGPAGSGGSLRRAAVGNELGKEEHDHRRRFVWGAGDSSRSSNEGMDGRAFLKVSFCTGRRKVWLGRGWPAATTGRDALPAAQLRRRRPEGRESPGNSAAGSVPSCQTTGERSLPAGADLVSAETLRNWGDWVSFCASSCVRNIWWLLRQN